MLGTGLLSLPLAFKHAGLWLGVILMVILCGICLYCMRLVVYAAHYICRRNGTDVIDYANVMRSAVESGPTWISIHGYFFKQLLNINMFCAQLGFCCIYFVFMADNIKSFFDMNTMIHLPKSIWMALLLIPILSICSIRRLNKLAPFAFVANCLYLSAVCILLYFFFTHLKPSSNFPAIGQIKNVPLYFGTVLFAFEGIAVILPVENRMSQPQLFIKWNGVLNCSCLVVMTIFAMMGFYGYLAVGDEVADTITLNVPQELIYQSIKLIFSICVMVSYPLQFFIPIERIEKWVTRKIPIENQTVYIYFARYGIVLLTCAIAELIPHLALFISFIGAFSGSSMALLFPPFIDLLVSYSRGTYTALVEIFKKIGRPI
ncbi:Proton-coupled amino acid transporter [Dirofilaria immitis]